MSEQDELLLTEDVITEMWWAVKNANKETPTDIPYDFAKDILAKVKQEFYNAGLDDATHDAYNAGLGDGKKQERRDIGLELQLATSKVVNKPNFNQYRLSEFITIAAHKLIKGQVLKEEDRC